MDRNTQRQDFPKFIFFSFDTSMRSDLSSWLVMKNLISTLACGKIELLLKQSAVYFVVTNFKDIIEKIIPLFDKYPIIGVKALDYQDFKKVAFLMQKKEHLTEQGLSNIQSIKLGMNSFRKK